MNKKNLSKIREELNKWRKDLLNRLSAKCKKNSENLCIIDKEWLNYFEKEFLIKELEDFEIHVKTKDKNNKITLFNEMRLKLRTKFLDANSLFSLPEIFVLNESCLEAFQNLEKKKENYDKIKGFFYNKLLLFKFGFANAPNCQNHCLFYIDVVNNLRQGYISINKQSEDEILKELKNSEPFEIFKKHKLSIKNLSFRKTVPNEFSIFIHNIDEKPIIKNDIPNNNDLKNNINIMKVNHIQIKLNEDLNKKNIENSKNVKLSPLEGKNKPTIKNIIFKTNQNKKIQKKQEIYDNELKFQFKQFCGNIQINNKNEKKNISKDEFNINNNKDLKEKIKKMLYPNINNEEIKKKKNVSVEKRDINKIKQIKIIEEPNKPEKIIKKELSKPGLIGLANIGATCYMNATLQCFSNVVRLRTLLLDTKIYQEIEIGKNSDKILSFAFAEVLKNLWENLNIKFYSPEYFKKVISDMNPMFKGVAANDSKDLILFMLENIHKELNTKKGVNYIQMPDPNPTDFNEVYTNFKTDFTSINDSIMVQEFYGYNSIINNCSRCNTTIYNVQAFNILFFPLEEVRKYKNYNINKVSILDCFDYNEKVDLYPSFYCNYCRGESTSKNQTKIVDSPKTLIINLNRGKGIQFNIDIIFEEYLDLKNYVYNQEIFYYELIGMICHYGESSMAGHFIAFCKNSEDGKWYKFNDGFVTESSFEEVCKSGMPYELYYSYIKV